MKTGRLFLLLILDDFSRFLVAHRLIEEPTSLAVVGTIQGAISLHGKPEAVYTDRAGAFLAWRNTSHFQNFLETNLIDHHVSVPYRPQGRGKIESKERKANKDACIRGLSVLSVGLRGVMLSP
ncbi:MAG: transposase family protein [Candidatus Glassbacteria bacterium]